MKKMNLIVCGACSVLLALGAVNARAQNTNAPGPDRTGPASPGGGRFFEGMGPAFEVLTPEQRASAAEAMQAQRERLRALEIKIAEARREFVAAGLSGKFDEETVRQRAQAVANLEAEIAVLRMQALARMQPPLSPDQIQKITNSMPVRMNPSLRGTNAPGRRRNLSDSTRDENDLPSKQPQGF
jgi:Spy/CpxP family protein refolding chaperone